MKLTDEEVTAILTDITEGRPTNPNLGGSEEAEFQNLLLKNDRFLRITGAGIRVYMEDNGLNPNELPEEERSRITTYALAAIKAGAELGYWLGLAEAEKRATGIPQMQRTSAA